MAPSDRSHRRVVVTGLGLISPLGNTTESLWDALQSGRSGVAPLLEPLGKALPCSFAGEAREFTGAIEDFGELESAQKKLIRKGLKVMCRESQMAVAAAQRALVDAGVVLNQGDPERSGIVFGSDYMLTIPDEFTEGIRECMNGAATFDFAQWGDVGMKKLSPLWLLKYLPNMPASHIAIFNDLRGPNNSITHREAAGNLAIGEAFRVIQRDHADLMLAGATGTRVHPLKAVHAVLQEEVASDREPPHRASRPFDRDRSGMVLGEGSGVVVLEELGAAQARGARIYAEVVGAGSSAVVDRRRVAHRDEAIANAVRAGLRDAGIGPDEIGHIHAHGLSTRTSDAEESRGLVATLGQQAAKIPVTAAKSYFGNLGAGGGVVEFIASTLALSHDWLFPILNYDTVDPDCPLNVVRGGDTAAGGCFVNVNVTPQGQASCVVASRFVS